MTDRDPWAFVREFTDARVAIGRAGNGLPTSEVLAFRLAHAQARDAVYMTLDAALLRDQLSAAGVTLPVLEASSAAQDRAVFLQRPDLGRQLHELVPQPSASDGYDLVFVLGDGLSARAVNAHAVATVAATLARLEGWSVAPIVLARQARVALGDPIGQALKARFSVMLIGERPGLSAADSLGAYLTYAPRPGRQNAERNCVSNIRGGGLSPDAAGDKIAFLLKRAADIGLTGVGLKDDLPMRLADQG